MEHNHQNCDLVQCMFCDTVTYSCDPEVTHRETAEPLWECQRCRDALAPFVSVGHYRDEMK